jgi:hypothetical protein
MDVLMKQLSFNILSTPDTVIGFHDTVQVDGGVLWDCSASPNGKKGNGEHWSKHYPWISDLCCVGKVVEHDEFGKCILLNDGFYLPSVNPNPNHNYKMIMNEIFFHEANIGYKNPEWRGSAGCLTMHRKLFPEFMKQFTVGELVMITIKRSIL